DAEADATVSPETNGQPAAPNFDLASNEWYLNRELTWLKFVERVLHEAIDTRNPLLERVRFLAIVGSIIDEFFMKRIGGLKQQAAAGVHERTVDGRTPKQQIQECLAAIRVIYSEQKALFASLHKDLRNGGVAIESTADLPNEEKDSLRAYYIENI